MCGSCFQIIVKFINGENSHQCLDVWIIFAKVRWASNLVSTFFCINNLLQLSMGCFLGLCPWICQSAHCSFPLPAWSPRPPMLAPLARFKLMTGEISNFGGPFTLVSAVEELKMFRLEEVWRQFWKFSQFSFIQRLGPLWMALSTGHIFFFCHSFGLRIS